MPRTKPTPQQREKHNARRRAKRLADARMRMATHAASQIVSWEWDGRRPVTPARVIAKTAAMYGNYREVQDQAITPAEARAALDHVLSR
ncbi:hypothetical protein ACFVFQ_08900 [Streptomyces sp. NPDC057743]|uniref:hypothetical protein n=1 Tax=Streptomyces sp. NPDC057743 TaxID=3346236 RepID=UPI0036C5875E